MTTTPAVMGRPRAGHEALQQGLEERTGTVTDRLAVVTVVIVRRPMTVMFV
jgi:hypothetical protein